MAPLIYGATVPYASGQLPVPGDYVKNQWEQKRVSVASNGEESVTVRWDDGGVDSPLTPAKEFILISIARSRSVRIPNNLSCLNKVAEFARQVFYGTPRSKDL